MRVTVICAVVFGTGLVQACGASSELRCGEGTIERKGECVRARPDSTKSGGLGGASGAGGTAGSDSAGNGALGGAGGSQSVGGSAGRGGAQATGGIGGSGAEGGEADPGGSGGGGEGGADGGSAGQPGTTGATREEVERAAALCNVPEAGVLPLPTEDVARSLIVGRWLYCEGFRMFGRDDVAGFRVDADGAWKFLLLGPDGLVDGAGFDNIGTWTILDTLAGFYLELRLAGGTSYSMSLAFSTTAAKVTLDARGGPTVYASLEVR